MTLTRLALVTLLCCPVAVAAEVASVMDFGAKADGVTNDAAAIQKAIDAAHAAGGGVALLPPGNYLTGTIHLKSNVTLRISAGATLWGSRRAEDYNPMHLIYARGAQNIAIEGDGTINGNGDAFWLPDFKPRERRPSPAIELVECKDVRIEDVKIRNTAGWGIHPLVCERVFIRGISMISDYRGPNTDGIDPDSSRDVVISDCYIETGDDAIVIKTTGRLSIPPPPSENITVTNCVLLSDDAALKLGTESHGDFRNIVFSNCAIKKTRVGLAIYAKDGGAFENVSFSNIAIETEPTHPNSVEYPIFMDLEKRFDDSHASRVRDINFSGITIRSRGRILAGGMPERPLEDLTFRNVFLRSAGYEPVEQQKKPRGSSRVRRAPPEIDYSPAPSAMVFANVRGLSLDNVGVVWDSQEPPQPRHAIYAARVEDLSIRGFSGRAAEPGGQYAAIGLDQARRVFISGSRLEGKGVFVGLRQTPAGEILLSGNDLRQADAGTKEGALYVHIP